MNEESLKEPVYKGYMDLELMYWQNPTPDTSKFAVSYLFITYSLN